MSKKYRPPRHQCPECRKLGKKRQLTCSLCMPHGEYQHWVNCPDHGQQLARKGI